MCYSSPWRAVYTGPYEHIKETQWYRNLEKRIMATGCGFASLLFSARYFSENLNFFITVLWINVFGIQLPPFIYVYLVKHT